MELVEQLRQKISALDGKKKELETRLGESFYEEAKNNQALRDAFESLVEPIDKVDAEIAMIKEEIAAEEARLKAEAAAEESCADNSAILDCPKCGKPCSYEDQFCSQCGASLQDLKGGAEKELSESPLVCRKCGKAFNAGDLFCMSCGSKLV